MTPRMTLAQALAPYHFPNEKDPQREELTDLVDRIHHTADSAVRWSLIQELRSKCKHHSGKSKLNSLSTHVSYSICPVCNSIV